MWTYSYIASDINDGNYLAHFGVQGMKWGKRKDPNLDKVSAIERRRYRQEDNFSEKMQRQNAKTMHKINTRDMANAQKQEAVAQMKQRTHERMVREDKRIDRNEIVRSGLVGGILAGPIGAIISAGIKSKKLSKMRYGK